MGLDVSLAETAICLVDADGIIIAETKTPSEQDAIGAWLTERDVQLSRVVLRSVAFHDGCASSKRWSSLKAWGMNVAKRRGNRMTA